MGLSGYVFFFCGAAKATTPQTPAKPPPTVSRGRLPIPAGGWRSSWHSKRERRGASPSLSAGASCPRCRCTPIPTQRNNPSEANPHITTTRTRASTSPSRRRTPALGEENALCGIWRLAATAVWDSGKSNAAGTETHLMGPRKNLDNREAGDRTVAQQPPRRIRRQEGIVSKAVLRPCLLPQRDLIDVVNEKAEVRAALGHNKS